ncbi:MAG TPA: DUF1398 family protein [Tepidisphaeraceae bacterium]|nr:DUF1398 family protein [Tepidisphaeraceae bacterium]
MTEAQKQAVNEVAELSHAGKIHFGEVVGRLMEAGIERYHADYSRGETTYYMPDGSSHVVSISLPMDSIAREFSASAVQDAVRRAQRGEVFYPEFVKLTAQAGCVGYFVQITGRRVQYFGRDGDVHVELFPGAR